LSLNAPDPKEKQGQKTGPLHVSGFAVHLRLLRVNNRCPETLVASACVAIDLNDPRADRIRTSGLTLSPKVFYHYRQNIDSK
jgi:hypothetical protein